MVGSREYEDINQCTALFWAAAKGHREFVQLLLEKSTNTEAAKKDGETALYISAQNVKLLLDQGANTETPKNDGETALYISAQNGHPEVVKLLLAGCGYRGCYRRWGNCTRQFQHRIDIQKL